MKKSQQQWSSSVDSELFRNHCIVYKHLEEDYKPEGLLLNLLLMEFSAIGNSTLLICKTGSLLTASV